MQSLFQPAVDVERTIFFLPASLIFIYITVIPVLFFIAPLQLTACGS